MKISSYWKAGILAAVCLLASLPAAGQPAVNPLRETSDEYFRTADALRVGDQVLAWQRVTGGWPKNIDMARRMSDDELAAVLADKNRRDDSTIDNDATTMQMKFLARLYRQTGEKRFRDGFLAGVQYLLDGQYENGGWPQFWPVQNEAYSLNITFNDDAIINTINLFRDIVAMKSPYDGNLTTPALRKKLQKSVDKGLDIILKCQIVVNGEPTVWCQQHDPVTLAPASARAYELPSFCSQESAALVRFLMELPDPDERVKKAVHGAMKWFDTYKLTGLRVERTVDPKMGRITRLVEDRNAAPVWGRFYDLEYCEPYVCDRDGLPRRRLEEIGFERRSGYSWYGSRPADLYPIYEEWADRYDPAGKVNISLDSRGANENGLIEMYRKPRMDRSQFDAVVRPGESIQAAIEAAPEKPSEPYKILILKGDYRQKVIIDRPNIVLVGEDRDETRISLAETAATREIKEYHGKEVGNGVIVLQEGADDCVISGLTVYNDYGVTVEGVTSHQMAIFGRATRTIVINSNVWAAGNDALSLWAPGGGMYYHADLDVRCLGIDFLCPRGWCYVTRSTFTGAGHAIIWHDGHNDRAQKLVIKDSCFDAMVPTVLGRFHHDHQFFLLNCRMSKMIKDEDIAYAYTDKVLDPCPWGHRTYYWGCWREGGNSGWLRDNLTEAENAVPQYSMTARWTFDGKWDPESRIRDLWSVLCY